MILSIGKILSNIVNMFMYLFLGASSSTSVFLMAYLFNASEKSGGLKLGDKNGFTLLIFFLFNIFFGCLTFFNTSRKNRVNCVLILSIIFTVYNIIKQISIVLRILLYEKSFNKVIEEKKSIDEITKYVNAIKNDNNYKKVNNGNDENNINEENGKYDVGNLSEEKNKSIDINDNNQNIGNFSEVKNKSIDINENNQNIGNFAENENSGAFQNENRNENNGVIDIPV